MLPEYAGVEHVFLYGELYGGQYPHPDVDPVPGLQAVQTGVYYSPHIEFCAFDLRVVGDQMDQYVDFDEMVRYLQV